MLQIFVNSQSFYYLNCIPLRTQVGTETYMRPLILLVVDLQLVHICTLVYLVNQLIRLQSHLHCVVALEREHTGVDVVLSIGSR